MTPAVPAATGPSRWPRRVSGALLALLVAFTAYVATNLHRRGHTTGDDFALYLRQATSLFNGNMAQVISDNLLLAKNSVGVTPGMYPWGYPLLLSPVVRQFGLDYERLKLVDVAALCVWLVLFHGIVRRRAGRIVALALTAVFATAPVYLLHTDQLLTELPHMAAVAGVIWMLDRIMTRHRMTTAPTLDLIVLGLLMVVAYNIRRESIVLVAVVAGAELVDVVAARSWSIPWVRLATPLLTFVVGAALVQFMLPATLIPDNDNSKRYIPTRLFTDYPGQLTTQLGIGNHPLGGRILLALAAAGVVLTCVTVGPAQRSARRADGRHDARGRNPLPDGGAVLLPGHAVGGVLRHDADRHLRQAGRGPAASAGHPDRRQTGAPHGRRAPGAVGHRASTCGASPRGWTPPARSTTPGRRRAGRPTRATCRCTTPS